MINLPLGAYRRLGCLHPELRRCLFRLAIVFLRHGRPLGLDLGLHPLIALGDGNLLHFLYNRVGRLLCVEETASLCVLWAFFFWLWREKAKGCIGLILLILFRLRVLILLRH